MDIAILGAIIPLLWIISIVALFWVYADAKEKQGTNIGCLWGLIVFVTGPIGIIAYLIVRNAD